MKRKSDCTPEEWARIWAAEKARRAAQKEPTQYREDGTRAYRRASPAPVVRDPIYDPRRDGECHQDTGCLWRACDYGHQVRSGQLSGKQWDIDRLKLGVAYVAASLLRRKEDRK